MSTIYPLKNWEIAVLLRLIGNLMRANSEFVLQLIVVENCFVGQFSLLLKLSSNNLLLSYDYLNSNTIHLEKFILRLFIWIYI